MKYNLEIEINKPIDKVIELFDNSDNMKEWMEGLQSFEHISGTPGQVGAKSRLKFKSSNREIEMMETVTVRNLPEEFSGTYEMKGAFNIVRNKFIALPDHRTKYMTEQEFEFSGFMKIMSFLIKGACKKQSMKYMVSFKNFVEKS